MRLTRYLVLVVLLAIVLYPQCLQAGWPARGGRRGGGSSTSYYVVSEVTGYSVSCNVYTKTQEIEARKALVIKQNRELDKANKAVDAEIKKLRGQLAAKGRELAKSDDTVRKTEVQTDIASLKTQIAQKDGERKPLTNMLEPRKFDNREDADKYVEAVLRQAQKAIEKQDEKKDDKKGDA